MQCHNGSVDIFLKYQITLHSNWFEDNMWFVIKLVVNELVVGFI